MLRAARLAPATVVAHLERSAYFVMREASLRFRGVDGCGSGVESRVSRVEEVRGICHRERVLGTRATSEVSFRSRVTAGQGSVFDPSSCSVAWEDVPRQSFPDMRFLSFPRGLRFSALWSIRVAGAPNKSPVPTPLAVTPRAEPRVAPLQVVAHL